MDLSGGQWQRLGLSRAFMRASSADLLILDEPTSSLDPEAEHEVFQFIQRRKKTTIYVTHRFYTVRMATKIAFLEDGKLIEWGGHDELMSIDCLPLILHCHTLLYGRHFSLGRQPAARIVSLCQLLWNQATSLFSPK